MFPHNAEATTRRRILIPVKIVFEDENNLYWYWFRFIFIVGNSYFFVAPRITALTMVVIIPTAEGRVLGPPMYEGVI